MRDVQFGLTPPIPKLGSFIETNVRTYVIDALGRPAGWFFSLDVPRSAVVVVARSMFGLPYRWAHAEHTSHGDLHQYRTERRRPTRRPAGADIRFRVGEKVTDGEAGELDHFLARGGR